MSCFKIFHVTTLYSWIQEQLKHLIPWPEGCQYIILEWVIALCIKVIWLIMGCLWKCLSRKALWDCFKRKNHRFWERNRWFFGHETLDLFFLMCFLVGTGYPTFGLFHFCVKYITEIYFNAHSLAWYIHSLHEKSEDYSLVLF